MNSPVFDVYTYLRKLAKTTYWQNMYSSAKDLNISLFKNTTDLTRIQSVFISFLSFYYTIKMDIALGDVSSIVLEYTIYEDAYIYCKNLKTTKTPEREMITRTSPTSSTSQWICIQFRGRR